ncbi:BsaA family SipW-dependent biofilm matrix protein [Tepidanaerobacter sp. EBM-49]|uniref:BsaA family SipW-dependent biofilm matrix protein n=1 Tax=Tepidanaerobacter sp. EBM-49 TaxID=1918504 RepID=UPI000B01AD70|nr:BsaA family SipW-dependent biofilm matrix protein [Tepidanaerobacter sp. EBM-49]
MRKNLLIGLLVFSLAALLVVGGTMAWFTDSQTADNKFTAGTVAIEIDEHDFQDITNWNPGDTTNKDVSIKSTGSKGTYVRVKLTPVWGALDGDDFIEADPALPTTNVTLNISDSTKWIYSDGWYYYSEIMSQDEETDLLLDSVTIAGLGTDNSYQGKTLKVDVEAEAVQASHEAYKDAFGITSLPDGVEAWSESTPE